LLVARVVDRRTVLRAYVVALAHPLRRVVGLPEYSQQVSVGDLVGVEDDQHDFRVSGSAAARLPIGRVWCEASCVTYDGRIDAIDLPELALGPPEAAEAEDRGTQTLGKGGSSGVPRTACLSGSLNAACSRPGSALAGAIILVLWRLKSIFFAPSTQHFARPKSFGSLSRLGLSPSSKPQIGVHTNPKFGDVCLLAYDPIGGRPVGHISAAQRVHAS
jgi:hypothetical protein